MKLSFTQRFVKPHFFAGDDSERMNTRKTAMTVTILLTVICLIMKMVNIAYITDMLVLGLIGQAVALLLADVWRNNTKDKCHNGNHNGNGHAPKSNGLEPEGWESKR